MEPAQSYEDVVQSIRAFNEALAAGDEELATILGYVRAWYFAPELGLVGPSRFVGYRGMSAAAYREQGESLNGRFTEPVLARWFRPVEPGTLEAARAQAAVHALLARHHRVLNRKARVCAPIGWRLSETSRTAELVPVVTMASDVAGGYGGQPKAHLSRTIKASITRGIHGFVAECLEVAVVTQGATLDATIENLKEAVALHLDGEDTTSMGLVQQPMILLTMELDPWAA